MGAGTVRGLVLPVYLAMDESGSMAPVMAQLNEGLDQLGDELGHSPMSAARLRVTILGFSEDAVVRLHLADLRSFGRMPTMAARGGTNFEVLFDTLAQLIREDIRRLRMQQFRIHRPLVVLVTDGLPTTGGDWRQAHARLVDKAANSAAPNIVAFGVGEADARSLLEISSGPGFAFTLASGQDVAAGMGALMSALTNSLVASASALNLENPRLVVRSPEGFTHVTGIEDVI